MFRLLLRTDFCIRLRTSLLRFAPNISLILLRSPLENPPGTSITMLIWVILYPGYCFLISHGSGAYLRVFSSSFYFRFSNQGQLISNRFTVFLSLSTILASTLLARTSVWSVIIIIIIIIIICTLWWDTRQHYTVTRCGEQRKLVGSALGCW